MSASYLKIGGELIQNSILNSVEVTQQLNDHSWCRIQCRQTRDERFPIEASLGKDAQVLTYNEDDTENIVFDGFILEASLEYEVYGSFVARLTAVSRSYKLSLTTQQRYFLKKTINDIAAQLAGEDGLKAVVQCADKPPLNYVQWGESDFDFLRRIADDHGAWMRASAQGIEIDDSFQDGEQVEWSEEGGLLGFQVTGKLAQPAFNGTHYDPQVMKSQTYKNVHDQPQFFGSVGPMVSAVLEQSQACLPAGYIHSTARAVTLDDYQALLKKESVRALGAKITGTGKSLNSKLCPGNKITIAGPMDAQGVYGLTRVVHRWNQSGYLNEFWCTPWMQYTEPHPPEPRRWFGVVPARVVEHNDPKKMGRIKVQYLFQEDGPAHWARMMTPHAGGDRGFMFMPEVGDEVVVAFEDGDPERPLVLGCVWNGVDQAPRGDFRSDDIAPNEVKRIVTKSGNRLQFCDTKGKESIVLSTPNSVKVSLIAANGSPTGRETLLLQSEHGDIILNAPEGRIHLHSKRSSREIG